jgi:LysR family nitrogen assimilation transcriptional regulator
MRFFYNDPVNLRQIEYFLRVAELRSFTRAAVSLGVTQPSLSRQIRLLEVELRQTLLHRNGRGVRLTPAGECLHEHGQTIVQAVQGAVGALNNLRTDPRGRVVIGLPTRIARVLTTDLVHAFRREFPHASITVSEGSSSSLHEWLLLGRIDLALLFDPPPGPDLELELLHTEELVLVEPRAPRARAAGARASLPLKDLQKYPLILPRSPNATRAVLEAAVARFGLTLDVSTEVDTVQNILELVAARVGYAVLPLGAVTNARSDRVRITRIHSPVLHQHLFLALSRRHPKNRLANELVRLVRAADLPRHLG